MHSKTQYVITLAHLLKFGKGRASIEITTTELGSIIDRSQQYAHYRVDEIEESKGNLQTVSNGN